MQQRGQAPFGRRARGNTGKDRLDQQGVFGDRIGIVPARLTVPARDKGQPMGNVFNFNIHRGRVQQI